MDARRVAVLEEARSWLNTRWHHRQCVKGAGVDCGQFIKACFVNAGLVEDFDTGYYPADWMKHRREEVFLEWVERYCDRIEAPEPADIAVFKYGLCFSHGAIVVDWPTLIHAYLPERKVVLTDVSRAQPLATVPVRFYSRFARL